MPMEWAFFAVVRIHDGVVVYRGGSLTAAATALEPGTVCGTGDTPRVALNFARWQAEKNHRIPAAIRRGNVKTDRLFAEKYGCHIQSIQNIRYGKRRANNGAP